LRSSINNLLHARSLPDTKEREMQDLLHQAAGRIEEELGSARGVLQSAPWQGDAGLASASSQADATVVLLAHARTDTRWFHDWVYGKQKRSVLYVAG
jgi:hypothetical protein